MLKPSDEERSPGRVVNERAVIDALPRAIIVTAPDGEIVLWNARAEALYGWSADEVVGRAVSDVLVPVDHLAQAEEIMQQVIGGETWSGDFTVLRRDGDLVRVRVIDQPVVDADGTLVAIVGASEDVTEERLLQQRAADLTDHLRLALDAGELGTWQWDMASGLTMWDAKM